MDNTPAYVEETLSAALNKALRDLVSKGVNLWLWEGWKPFKITVRSFPSYHEMIDAEEAVEPKTEDYVWQVKTYSQPASEKWEGLPHIFKVFVENTANTLFNTLELIHDTVIFSAYPVFKFLQDDPHIWARVYIRIKYLNVPLEVARSLSRTNEKIRSLDLDAPLTHRK